MKLIKDTKIPVLKINDSEKLIITSDNKTYIIISCDNKVLKVDTSSDGLNDV